MQELDKVAEDEESHSRRRAIIQRIATELSFSASEGCLATSSPKSDLETRMLDTSIPLFIEDLYFVAKDGSVDCIHSKASCWALNKIASEVL